MRRLNPGPSKRLESGAFSGLGDRIGGKHSGLVSLFSYGSKVPEDMSDVQPCISAIAKSPSSNSKPDGQWVGYELERWARRVALVSMMVLPSPTGADNDNQ